MTDLSDIRSAVGAAVRERLEGLLGDAAGFGAGQHARLLRLHTPLGAGVLQAERARITEAIGPVPDASSAFEIELFALSTDALLDPVDLIGRPVLLELLTAHSREALRPFHGHVLAFELLGSDGGMARYRLHIGTWLDFLRHRTDSWVFQDQSVVDITEAVFADHVEGAARGGLQPAWRWDLKDAQAYPRLSTFSQHAETDFDFLARLWAANGLFHWFEHTGQPGDGASFGAHTLVIADHNGAFRPNGQARIRYTQPGAAMKEDSITRWHGVRRMGVSALHTASHDYRTVSNHAGSLEADAAHRQDIPLVHADQPGAYAFETPEEASRMARIQMEALQAQRKQFQGRGTVRTLAPASTFVLAGHAEHDRDMLEGGEDAACFAVLSVVHAARNNLGADAKAGLRQLDGYTPPDGWHEEGAASIAGNSGAEPVYEARFTVQRAAVPCRPPMHDGQGRPLHAEPTAWGTQTALVVGLDGPVHTDRDGRVKVQFHWQRGAQASHRQAHPAGDNAPASDASGTWVRVAQDWAGANWGGVFIPRLGQEVVVAFVEGDIDRPVIIGAAYNGEGSEDAQGNRMAGGAANATGNAPAWFPGGRREGDLDGHAHNAALSGFKSQSLDASQAGSGGHNQLVFDDTPGQGRVLAHTTQSQTWLQMGHLLRQHDNRRLAPRGHGLELHTQAQGALRAGSGLHIGTHAAGRGSTGVQGQPMQTREAQTQLQGHAELVKALAGSAQTHLAKLPGEAAADALPARRGILATVDGLRAVRTSGAAGEGDAASGPASSALPDDAPAVLAIDGGHGTIPVFGQPHMVLSAAADIASLTPASTAGSIGGHATVTAGQDTQLLSQRHMAWAVKDGISLFTRGEARDAQRPVQDTGIRLHAASGNVNVQAQGDAFRLTAEKAIDVQSTAASVVISAPERIVFNGGGAYLKIEGGDIEMGTSGAAVFKAGMKELGGAGAASRQAPVLAAAQGLFNEAFVVKDEDSGQIMRYVRYRIEDAQGHVLAQGMTDEAGRTARVHTRRSDQIRLFLLD